jgi:hypothetical protein
VDSNIQQSHLWSHRYHQQLKPDKLKCIRTANTYRLHIVSGEAAGTKEILDWRSQKWSQVVSVLVTLIKPKACAAVGEAHLLTLLDPIDRPVMGSI